MAKKEYFIEQNGIKQGAFSLEELLKKDIYDDAIVWKAGWEDWKNAMDVEELNNHVIIKPPLTKNEIDKQVKNERKSEFIKGIKETYQLFLILTALANIIWNVGYFNIAKNGGTYQYPIYLTYEERMEPSLIFWNALPMNTLIVTLAAICVWFVVLFFRSNDKSPNQNNQNDIVKLIDTKQTVLPVWSYIMNFAILTFILIIFILLTLR